MIVAGISDLAGKTAVVTGGSSGIGLGMATRFVEVGMNVVIAAKNPERLDAAAAEIGAVGFPVDVTELVGVQALAEFAVSRFGAVHVLCNNAGVGTMAPIARMTMDDWRWMIDANLYSVIHGIQVFLPVLEKNAAGGHIVNTASVGGLFADAYMAGYAVTKFGVVALTESLAAELRACGSKVGATVLIPGPVPSNLNTSMRNRPDGDQGSLVDFDLTGPDVPFEVTWRQPSEVADIALRCIHTGELYAVTHPETFGKIQERHQAIADAFATAEADQAKPGPAA